MVCPATVAPFREITKLLLTLLAVVPGLMLNVTSVQVLVDVNAVVVLPKTCPEVV